MEARMVQMEDNILELQAKIDAQAGVEQSLVREKNP